VTGLFVLRYRRPFVDRPYRAVGYPVLPAIYVVLCALVMLNLLVVKFENAGKGLVIVLAGVPVYFIWRFLGRAAKKAAR
jgi:APA family basic amino acid/polyamine antiporter